MDIEKQLEAEQHSKLRELHAKLDEVLEYEPVDSGNAIEDSAWEQMNSLKATLDFLFDGGEP